MIQRAFDAYEGTEPFLFISYAHKDMDRVMPILNQLHERGHRIWYDDGIAPGSEWPEYIAEHLTKSATVIAFVSANSLASSNCRREITFALSKKKNFLAVILEEADMSPGMEMQLSAQQSILYYNYSDDEKFLKKLCNTDIVEITRVSSETSSSTISQASSAAASERSSDISSANENTNPRENRISDEDMKAVEHMENLTESASDPEPDHEKEIKKTGEKNGKVKRKIGKKILIGILCIVALAGAARVIIPRLNRVEITDEVTADRDATYIRLKDITLTADMITQLNKLTNLNKLILENCDLSAVDLVDLNTLTSLRGIEIVDCSGVNWDFLQKDFPVLNTLTIRNSGLVNGVNFAGMPELQELDLRDNPSFSSLTGLDAPYLRVLQISNTSVTMLPERMIGDNLQKLDLANTQVTDINDFMLQENLQELNVNGCAIDSIDQECKSLRLTKLDLGNTNLTDLSAFDNLTILTDLDLTNTGAESAICLQNSAETLKNLYLEGTALDEQTMSTIGSCTGLEELNLTDVDLSALGWEDLQILSSAENLQVVYAGNTGLTSGAGLEGHPELTTLILSNNPLEQIPNLTESEQLDIIDLRNCQLTDVSFLPEHRKNILLLDGNPLNLSEDESGVYLNAYLMSIDYVEELTELEISSNQLYILEVPEDRKVALEDHLIGKSIYYVTAAQIEEYVNTYGYITKWED